MSKISLTASMRSNLLALQNTSKLMNQTQERLSTGNKVNSAIDNPSSYYTARSLNNRASDLGNLLDSMGQAISTIKAANEGAYDLVFMDIQMPEMNGLEATRAIRKLDTWASSIPIVAMTADAFAENINECLEAGMNGHIAKPIDIKLVIKVIQKIKEECRK